MTVLIKRQLMFIEINNKLAKCHNFIQLLRENSQEQYLFIILIIVENICRINDDMCSPTDHNLMT